MVDASGKVVEHLSHLAKLLCQVKQRLTAQVVAGKDAHAVHLLGSLLAYTPYLLHLQLGNEVEGTVRVYHGQTVRLAPVGGYLGQKLAVADASRRRQLCGVKDALLNLHGHVDAKVHAFFIFSHVKEGLVERQGLYQVGIVVKDVAYLVRHFLILLEMGLDDDKVGTQTLCHLDGLCRVYPIATCLVAGGRHHPSGGIPAHSHGFASQFRTVALLDGSKELVHVDVNDFSHALSVMSV